MAADPRIVIVGASAAGVSAAVSLRRSGFTGDIVLVDRDANRPYERPPLSKSLLGPDTPLRPIVPDSVYTDNRIDLILGVGVDRIEPATRTVHLDDGRCLAADLVLLATGVRPRQLELTGQDLANVLVLRDAADAAALGARLASGGSLVIIGAGFIGLELAALARDYGMQVSIVEITALPLLGIVGPQVATLIHDLHTQRGTSFHLNRAVTELVGATSVTAVVLDDGQQLPADTVVLGVGVSPNDELARMAGIETDAHGIVVDRFGATSDPWVFAAGDVASQPHPVLTAPGRIEHWDVAMRHGAAVGASMAGTPTEAAATPYAWSDQFGLTYQFYGRPRSTDTFVLREGGDAERFIAFWLRDGHVVAVLGLDHARAFGAARRLVDSAATIPTAILSDPTTDLRQLAKGLARIG